MPKSLPRITEADVRRLATEQSFERGIEYNNWGAILDGVQQGNELRAYCRGSAATPYRVSATFDAYGISTTHCTCPYDWGGICKHVVALLLTWIHSPEAFLSLPILDKILAQRSKEELILLVKEMLKRQPDLTRLLELPLQPDGHIPLDLEAYRRQIDHAFGFDYPDAVEIAAELAAVIDTANRFHKAGDWKNAGALYHLVLDEIMPTYGDLFDENGDVALELSRCAEGLDDCLSEGSPDAETRRAWLGILLKAKFKDIESGGIDLAYPAPDIVIRHATDDEWAWIESRVRQVIATCESDHYSRWKREALVSFLARRLEARDRGNETDDLILDLGSPEQQAFLHANRGRFEQAVTLAERHFTDLPGLVIRFADALVAAGAGNLATDYLIGQLEEKDNTHYMSWLAEHAEAQGDPARALDWRRKQFDVSPNLHTYQALRETATRLDHWGQVRPQLIEQLKAAEQWGTLIEIALDEHDAARALELLPHINRGWYGGDYAVRVARIAQEKYPQAALDIYLERAERLIAARGRGNYQSAASLLACARDIYKKQNTQDTWDRYITDLRQRHRRLPALQDELNRASL